MLATFISLLGSLTQAQIVWTGDITIVMSDGSVDWLGLFGLAVIVCFAWVASRKR